MRIWNSVAMLAAALAATLLITACADGGSDSDCGDGIDNDGDMLIDGADPGCIFLNGEAQDPGLPACSDLLDNDGDGAIDFPDDPGCDTEADDDEYNELIAQCRDGIDNDGDGLIDFPNDPGCKLSLENSEEDDCPDGPNCPACANAKDDDGDGINDYPADPGCDGASDDDEINADPSICGANAIAYPLAADGIATGAAVASSSNDLISVGCNGSGAETAYTIDITERTTLVITTDFPETTLDTVLYVRSVCRDPATEIGCNDDTDSGRAATLTVDVDPGSYFIIVDAHHTVSSGDYKLSVERYTPRGSACDTSANECAPGLVCRLLDGNATQTTCELPECSDGLDNDGDSLIDFPNEPGCSDAADNDETDDCPSGAGCPECGNGTDDDQDTLTDFSGGDPGCQSASDTNEIDDCVPGVEVRPLTGAGASGTTSGSSFFTGSCELGTAPEHVYSYRLARAGLVSLTFSTIGSTNDTATYVRFGTCNDTTTELVCEDPGTGGEDAVIETPVPGEYFVFVDGDASGGDYVLGVTGIIPPDGACDPSDAVLSCAPGYKCDVDTCKPAACNDGIDNDADTFTDFPFDPGCASPSDDDETDDCPSGPNCPQCGNGIDDDGDTKIDLAQDPGCSSAADNVEDDCPGETDAVTVLTTKSVAGTTTGANNDFLPSCSTGSTAPDRVYVVTIPGDMKLLRFDTIGSDLDTVLSVKLNECANDDLDCNDEGDGPFGSSTVELADAAAGTYLIIVDGYTTNAGDFVLNISGEIKAGAACDDAQVTAGMLTCEAGYACSAGTCQPAACNDGVDNGDSEDTLVDFPNDPGCASISDNDESDDCPTGPNCPACSNQIDDDLDGAIDFGDDLGCIAAGDDNEIDECIPGVEVEILTDAGATGTTPPSTAGSNFTGSCHTSTLSTDKVYAYKLGRDMSELTFSTVGSTGNTVTFVRFGDCGSTTAELVCASEDPEGEAAVVTNPAAGWYYVFVDGDFISEIDYVLNVSGRIAANGACDPLDTQFSCAPGYVCTGTTPTCEPTACNDGIDNDGDTKIDAMDPGCDSVDDDTEDPDPNPLPQCSNGSDDDGDGTTDYPDDPGCSNAADDKELACDDADPIVNVTAPTTNGSSTGASNDFTPSCQGNSTAGDVAYRLVIPGTLSTLDVDTGGTSFDTVLMVKQSNCSNDDFACDDDWAAGVGPSEVNLTDVPAGHYFVIVDGYASNEGAFTLNIEGVLASGEPCDPAQATSGLITCPTGEACADPGTGFVCQ